MTLTFSSTSLWLESMMLVLFTFEVAACLVFRNQPLEVLFLVVSLESDRQWT